MECFLLAPYPQFSVGACDRPANCFQDTVMFVCHLIWKLEIVRPGRSRLICRTTAGRPCFWSPHYSAQRGTYTVSSIAPHPRLLRNCIRLYLGAVPWKAFPSRYVDRSLCPFRDLGTTHFEIELECIKCWLSLHPSAAAGRYTHRLERSCAFPNESACKMLHD